MAKEIDIGGRLQMGRRGINRYFKMEYGNQTVGIKCHYRTAPLRQEDRDDENSLYPQKLKITCIEFAEVFTSLNLEDELIKERKELNKLSRQAAEAAIAANRNRGNRGKNAISYEINEMQRDEADRLEEKYSLLITKRQIYEKYLDDYYEGLEKNISKDVLKIPTNVTSYRSTINDEIV